MTKYDNASSASPPATPWSRSAEEILDELSVRTEDGLSEDGATVTTIWGNGDLGVTGIGVPHGDVPTIGYRVDYGELSVAFSSDQNGSNEAFVEFVKDVDYLVIHMAGNENSTGVIANLHAKPSVWGQMATASNAGHVIVSHIATSDQNQLDENLSILAENYSGPVTVASDLMCVDVR